MGFSGPHSILLWEQLCRQDQMRRRYRPRLYARAHLGCLGCSVPLALVAVVVAVYAGALLGGLAL